MGSSFPKVEEPWAIYLTPLALTSLTETKPTVSPPGWGDIPHARLDAPDKKTKAIGASLFLATRTVCFTHLRPADNQPSVSHLFWLANSNKHPGNPESLRRALCGFRPSRNQFWHL